MTSENEELNEKSELEKLEDAWIKEVEKRYRRYRKDKTSGIPARQVFDDIRQNLK